MMNIFDAGQNRKEKSLENIFPRSIRIDSTLRLLSTEFRSIRYHEEVAVGREWVILEETRLLLAE